MSTARSGQSLPRSERLRHWKEFTRAYEQGRRFVCRFFVAFVVVRPGGPLRLGVVASRRIGGAVSRNRAKRLLREVFRKRRPKREVSADVVLVARGPIDRASYQEVDAAYVRHVRKQLEKIP